MWDPWTVFGFSSIKHIIQTACFLLWGALSDERMGLQFTCTVASGLCQLGRAQVPQNSWPSFTVSYETPSTWTTMSLYLYPPRTGWPSCTPGHWVLFHLFLQYTGLRRRCSNPAPRGIFVSARKRVAYVESWGLHRNRLLLQFLLLLSVHYYRKQVSIRCDWETWFWNESKQWNPWHLLKS
jgi:hypothetical protein